MNGAQERISRPRDLGLPPDAEQVFEALTQEGEKAFSQEIVAALLKAEATNDFRPVRDVVEAWYRTLLFVRAPGHDEAIEWANSTEPGEGMTFDQFKDRLGI